MFNSPVVLYLASRISSAVGAFLAIAIFTRLIGAAEYGHYLLIFACGTIVFGLTTQWIIMSYFGVYTTERLDEFAASLFKLLAVALGIIAVGAAAITLLGFWDTKFLIAIFAMIFGMTLYFSLFDVTRTKLKSQSAAFSMIVRVVLMAAFGTAVLWQGGGAIGLAIAIMVAHVVASVPCWIATGGIRISRSSRQATIEILKYGWPLMLSFGITALGLNIDRLILVHYLGIAELGPYGAVSEFMRQCFALAGEAIFFSMITSAKQHSNDGGVEATSRTLRTAFNACVAAGTFGAAFFLVFGDRVVGLLFPAEFHASAAHLIPIFAVAYGFMTIGQYYFANVIYFTSASYLVTISSAILALVSSTLAVLLIPHYGPQGAAIAMLVGFMASSAVLIAISRRYYRMPIDLAGLCEITSIPAIFVLLVWTIGHYVPNSAALQISEAAVLMALGAYVVHRYKLLQPTSTNLVEEPEFAGVLPEVQTIAPAGFTASAGR